MLDGVGVLRRRQTKLARGGKKQECDREASTLYDRRGKAMRTRGKRQKRKKQKAKKNRHGLLSSDYITQEKSDKASQGL